MSQATGLLLIGHGTRNEQGTREFLALVPLLAARYSEMHVAPAFLELQKPTIADAIVTLVEQGTRQLVVAPLLLFAAGHAQQDIPAAVAAGLRQFPEVKVAQMPALECDPSLVALSNVRYAEACDALPTSQSRLLVLVGRGSREASATSRMHELADLRSQDDNLPVRVGFLAMAEPRLRDVLEKAASESWQQIIVQPHLLFQGELLQELHKLVNEFASRFPERQWRVTSHLAANLAENPVAERFLLDAISSRVAHILPALAGAHGPREFVPSEAVP